MARILLCLASGFFIAYLLWGLQDSKEEVNREAVGAGPGGVVLPEPSFDTGNSPLTTSNDPQPTFVESPREAEGYSPQSIGQDIDLDDFSVFDDAPVQILGDDIDVDDLSIFDNQPQIDIGEDIDTEDRDIAAFEIVQDLGEDIDPEYYSGVGDDQPEQSIGEDIDPDTP